MQMGMGYAQAVVTTVFQPATSEAHIVVEGIFSATHVLSLLFSSLSV